MADSPNGADVFLSHNRADKDWVRELGAQIESETPTGYSVGRNLRVWFDEWDIDVGQNVVLKIGDGLKLARYVAVVITPEFLGSNWTAMEWTHAIAEDPVNRAGRVIPLFLREVS